MKVEIRKAVSNDVQRLEAIARRTIDMCYRPFLGDANVDWFITSGASDQYVIDNIADCWVLITDHGITGFCVCKGDVIDLMMVDERYHRLGLGTALLQHCEDYLFTTYDHVSLESFEGNERANSFYRENGWGEHHRQPDSASGTTKVTFTKKAPGRANPVG